MLNDQLMQLVSEVVSTGRPSMPIVDPEEGAPRPVLRVLELGLDDVQDDGHAVLVVVTDDALVGVRRVGGHHSVSLACVLSRLVGLNELDDRGVQLVLDTR